MVDSYRDDYTRYRSGVIPYEIEDIQGRRTNGLDKAQTTVMVVGTTAAQLPDSPLGRRNFIKVKNLDSSEYVYILTEEDVTIVSGTLVSGTTVSGADEGYEVGPGSEWEDETDAPLWVVASSAGVEVSVYERSTR